MRVDVRSDDLVEIPSDRVGRSPAVHLFRGRIPRAHRHLVVDRDHRVAHVIQQRRLSTQSGFDGFLCGDVAQDHLIGGQVVPDRADRGHLHGAGDALRVDHHDLFGCGRGTGLVAHPDDPLDHLRQFVGMDEFGDRTTEHRVAVLDARECERGGVHIDDQTVLVDRDGVRAQLEEKAIAFGDRGVAGTGHRLGVRCHESGAVVAVVLRSCHCVTPSNRHPPPFILPYESSKRARCEMQECAKTDIAPDEYPRELAECRVCAGS